MCQFVVSLALVHNGGPVELHTIKWSFKILREGMNFYNQQSANGWRSAGRPRRWDVAPWSWSNVHVMSWHDTSFDGSWPILVCQTSIWLSFLLCRGQIDFYTTLQWSIMTNSIRICWNTVFLSTLASSLEKSFCAFLKPLVSQCVFGSFQLLRIIWKAYNLLWKTLMRHFVAKQSTMQPKKGLEVNILFGVHLKNIYERTMMIY
jgi:hypothetical protein